MDVTPVLCRDLSNSQFLTFELCSHHTNAGGCGCGETACCSRGDGKAAHWAHQFTAQPPAAGDPPDMQPDPRSPEQWRENCLREAVALEADRHARLEAE